MFLKKHDTIPIIVIVGKKKNVPILTMGFILDVTRRVEAYDVSIGWAHSYPRGGKGT